MSLGFGLLGGCGRGELLVVGWRGDLLIVGWRGELSIVCWRGELSIVGWRGELSIAGGNLSKFCGLCGLPSDAFVDARELAGCRVELLLEGGRDDQSLNGCRDDLLLDREFVAGAYPGGAS